MKKALITGSSSGIGFEYAKHLSQEGWSLDLVSFDEERSREARDLFTNETNTYHHLDLSKKESINQLVNSVDCPDLIVANAGITMMSKAGESSPTQREDLYYLLCGGVIDLIEAFIPKLKAKSNLKEITRSADILIVALGKAGFVKASMVKEGAVIVDVGITRVKSDKTKSGWKLKGDVAFDEVAPKCSFITPVPGGVGPMTIASLLKNTLISAQKRSNIFE